MFGTLNQLLDLSLEDLLYMRHEADVRFQWLQGQNMSLARKFADYSADGEHDKAKQALAEGRIVRDLMSDVEFKIGGLDHVINQRLYDMAWAQSIKSQYGA